MEQKESIKKHKGGRPKKAAKKDCKVSVRCSAYERTNLRQRAATVHLSVSEYLLRIGLSGKIVMRETVFPKGILQLMGRLNHVAANLNQIAKKRNGIEPLNAFERAELKVQSGEVKRLVESIKNVVK